ncbi:MAG TPA: nitrate- and nitrite sensing domain-containing protein [Actinomadura sp.]|nr:nitrate- and nitrite sensing domain-containing protein [Actinomadura sp.]
MLLSLAALWAFAAWVTLRDGLNLLWVSTIDSDATRPGVALVTELQRERRLSLIYLGSRDRQHAAALTLQRERTDKAHARFRRLAGGSAISRAASDDLQTRIKQSFVRLNDLPSGRKNIDSQLVDRGTAIRTFDDIVDIIFRIYGYAASLGDESTARDGRTLIGLTRAKEILSREDALLAGAMADGRFAEGEQAQFVQLMGAQRLLHNEAAAELREPDRRRYDQVVKGAEFTRFRALEGRVAQATRPGARLPVAAAQWQAAIDPVMADLEGVVLAGGEGVVERATPGAVWTIIRLLLAGGLGLLAVVASVVVSFTTARALVQQLEKLRNAAWELADERLPSVVERLGQGEEVDVAVEAPPLEFGTDEIGQVGQAFNAVQQTAIRVAVEQAELRRGIRDILLSLARRTQTLVRRQLSLLDIMERRELDPTELEDLFRVDHLATRMRRNAENLIVLSGATPARGWRRSVPMVDVLRAAVAEVEEYSRVNVLPVGQVTLAGRAVGDMTHLLAELIENAVSFSPSYTVVQVGGHMAASGYAIEIDDRGLGMSEESLALANDQIADSPEFNMSSTARLGLYVVSRLANRYGIRVSLKHSAYGGTTAIVLIPRELVVQDGEPEKALAQAGSDAPEPVGVMAAGGDPAMTPGLDSKAGGVQVKPQGPRRSRLHSAVHSRTGDREPGSGLPKRAGGRGDDDRPAAPGLGERGAVGDAGPVGASEVPGPESGGPDVAAKRTPSGLPFRVPQASLAPALRKDGPQAGAATEGVDTGRSPEEIRKVMDSYQTGTRRGRSAAAQSGQEGPAPGAPRSPAGDDPRTGPQDNL